MTSFIPQGYPLYVAHLGSVTDWLPDTTLEEVERWVEENTRLVVGWEVASGCMPKPINPMTGHEPELPVFGETRDELRRTIVEMFVKRRGELGA